MACPAKPFGSVAELVAVSLAGAFAEVAMAFSAHCMVVAVCARMAVSLMARVVVGMEGLALLAVGMVVRVLGLEVA